MSVEAPKRPVNTRETVDELQIPEIPVEERVLLTDVGRVCLELGLADQEDEPIVGNVTEINKQLEERTGLDHDSLVHAIHDIIHEDPSNEIRADNVPVDEGRSLVLTPEGLRQLREEINTLHSGATS